MTHRIRNGMLLAAAALALPVLACRYSIRDTGFVDFGAAPYRLSLKAGALPAEVLSRYRQAGTATLLDSNIEFLSDPPSPGPEAALVLSDASGRALTLAEGARLPQDAAGIVSLMESAATSPVRAQIQTESLRSFAVLVLVEGRDAAANERVRQTLRTAVGAVERLMPGMPKPVAVPPQIIPLPVASQAGERVLMWGLGLEPAPAEDPRVAIVYGRGRRLGAPLEGPAITRTGIQERLVMIGQDCECDLDRAWLQGPVIPGRWDRGLQEIAARTLGFDPENPMVRSEVSRIVLRGEGEHTRQQRPSTALALGYTEESIEAGDDAPLAGAATQEPAAAPAPVSRPSQTPDRPAPAVSALPLWIGILGVFGVSLGFGLWQYRRAAARHR